MAYVLGGGWEEVQDGAAFKWGREVFVMLGSYKGGEKVFINLP